MRKIGISLIYILAVSLTLGLTTAFASGKDDKPAKPPKNSGILSVKTSPAPYPVVVDGKPVGMSGVSEGAEFYLSPGVHKLEISFPGGKKFVRDIEIRKNAKNCVCLSYVEEVIKRPCPYNVRVDGPDKVTEGDLITFAAFNVTSNAPTTTAVDGPNQDVLKYVWKVFPENAKITSGQGTPAITVDTTGLAGQKIIAELDASTGFYDEICRQRVRAETDVERVVIVQPSAFLCDEFESKAFDDDKARLDNCVIQIQNNPDAQLYVIIYPGTDKVSTTRNTFEKLSKRTLDYLVKTRGIDPRRIQIVRGGTRNRTIYQLWIVPPGAQLPVPQ